MINCIYSFRRDCHHPERKKIFGWIPQDCVLTNYNFVGECFKRVSLEEIKRVRENVRGEKVIIPDKPEPPPAPPSKCSQKDHEDLKALCKKLLAFCNELTKEPYYIVNPSIKIIHEYSEIINKFGLFGERIIEGKDKK